MVVVDRACSIASPSAKRAGADGLYNTVNSGASGMVFGAPYCRFERAFDRGSGIYVGTPDMGLARGQLLIGLR